MFDKLVASEPDRNARDRRSYFMVSSLVVGVLFITAVVISIFAADFSLGSSNVELVEMLAPVEMAAPEPARQPQQTQRTTSPVASRQTNMQNLAEAVPRTPTDISVTKNSFAARPIDQRYVIGSVDATPSNGTFGRDTGPTGNGTSGLQVAKNEPEPVAEDTPPPVRVDPPRKPPVQTLGVINGKATYLPKPVYSAAATAVRAAGKVDVQVSIDESGRVTSATAVSGHPLLRQSAEQAARNAKFSVTYLSNVPVKVTGVIVYNFIR